MASRLDLPEQTLVEAVRAARCELLLGGVADAATEPERHLLGLGELVRLGDVDARHAIAVAPRVATAASAALRRDDRLGSAALDAAAVVLAAAGERRALADLARIRSVGNDGPTAAAGPVEDRDDVAVIPNVERRLVADGVLFPDGVPERWRGHDVEAHRLVAGPESRLSLALRWHGANAAVLWEIDGEPVTIRSAAGTSPWSSAQRRGEALWPMPAAVDPHTGSARRPRRTLC